MILKQEMSFAERRRIQKGRCPKHNICLTQIGVWIYESGDAAGPVMGCPLANCSFKIDATPKDLNAWEKDEGEMAPVIDLKMKPTPCSFSGCKERGTIFDESGKVATCQEHDPFRKNNTVQCTVCDELPTVGDTQLCGPHCFGEADTFGGNW